MRKIGEFHGQITRICETFLLAPPTYHYVLPFKGHFNMAPLNNSKM
jgi:hypothetical protein